MRSPDARAATAALVDRDPALPLDVLLDDDALTAWLEGATGVAGPVRRRYLRYKPGTSCTVLVERVDDGTEGGTSGLVVVSGHTPQTLVKLDKTVEKVGADALVAVDRDRRLLALSPAGDRHVHALGPLLSDAGAVVGRALGRKTGNPVGPVRTLAYKPHRRWVGSLSTTEGPLLLRAYRSGRMHAHAQVLRALQRTGVAVPRLRGTSTRRDLMVCDWVPGDAADTLLERHHLSEVAGAELRRVAAALARLHASTDVDAPVSDAHDEDAPAEVAEAVAALLPVAAEEAARLAGEVRDRLAATGDARQVLAHGDFSLDQVVLAAHGPVLLDLDHAGAAPAAADLGSALATVLADPARAGAAPAVLRALREGYADVAPCPPDAEIAAHAAAHLLRRAVEPFRQGEPDWTGALTRSLALVDLLLQDGLGALAQVEPVAAVAGVPT